MNVKALYQRLGRKGLVSLALIVAALAILGTLPYWLDVDTSYIGYYLFMTCVYLTVAQGWNLIAGYTGQISLGTHAFFGLGAYTMAGLWLNGIGIYFFFDVTLMIVAGIAPALLATLIGLLLLSRLKGDYLSFGTLGLAQIVYVLFVKGGKITGGANGIYLDASYFFEHARLLLGGFAGRGPCYDHDLAPHPLQLRPGPQGHQGGRHLGGFARHQCVEV